MTRSRKIIVYWDYCFKKKVISVVLADEDSYNKMDYNQKYDYVQNEINKDADVVSYKNRIVYSDSDNNKCELNRDFSTFNKKVIGSNMLEGDLGLMSPFLHNRIDVSLACYV